MLLREHARRLIRGLQAQHGYCFASERAKRIMVAEKRQGVIPGARSMYRAEKQLEAAGELERIQIWPGDTLWPNGTISSHHWVRTRLITRQERRAKERKRAKLEARRKAKAAPLEPRELVAPPPVEPPSELELRTLRRQRSTDLLRELVEPRKLAAIFDPPLPPPPEEQLALWKAERERQLAELAKLALDEVHQASAKPPEEPKPPDE
jgi:hypothetical protein